MISHSVVQLSQPNCRMWSGYIFHQIPTKRYTPQNKHGTWKWTLGKGDSYWKPSFPGSMLIFGGVNIPKNCPLDPVTSRLWDVENRIWQRRSMPDWPWDMIRSHENFQGTQLQSQIKKWEVASTSRFWERFHWFHWMEKLNMLKVLRKNCRRVFITSRGWYLPFIVI